MRIERVVLDTNVLISAAISQFGKPAQCFDLAAEMGWLWSSEPLLAEFDAKIALPRLTRLASHERFAAFATAVRAASGLVAPVAIAPSCRDPKDDVVLATALAARADAIVTSTRSRACAS